MTGWICALRLMPIMALVMITAPVTAQTLVVDNGPPVILGNSDANAALPLPIDPTWVPPREVVRMLRSTGYSVLSRPKLRGAIFSVAVVTPRGDDGRIFVDARDGRLLRFVPGYALTGRTEEEVGLAYQPPGSPPPGAARRASSSPTGIATVPPTRSESKPVQARSAPAQQTQAIARSAEPQAAVAKPADIKPPLVIQPTQDMPAVMGLD